LNLRNLVGAKITYFQQNVYYWGFYLFSVIEETNALEWKEKILEAKKLTVVEFWHQECPHCQTVEQVFGELSEMYGEQLKFTRLNVADSPENKQVATKYGVMATPTFLFFCGGRPVNGVVGALQKNDLSQAIEFTIQKHRDCSAKSTLLSLFYIS
jgi:thioredoxin 1